MVDSFLTYIQYEKNYSTRTVFAYKKDLEQFQTFLLNTYQLSNLLQADSKQVRSWLVSLKENKRSKTSINRKISSLKSFYKFLQREEKLLKENPLSKVSSLKKPKHLPNFFKENEMEQLLSILSQTKSTFQDFRNLIIIELLYLTGIRRAELIELKDCNFDFFSLTLRVVGKGNKERFIPFNHRLEANIKEYIAIRDKTHGPVSHFIVSNKGEKAYAGLIYRIVKEQMQKVSSASIRSPHVIRHSFATSLLNNGAEINAIKELLGHSSLAATQIYTHTTFEQLKLIYKKAHPRK